MEDGSNLTFTCLVGQGERKKTVSGFSFGLEHQGILNVPYLEIFFGSCLMMHCMIIHLYIKPLEGPFVNSNSENYIQVFAQKQSGRWVKPPRVWGRPIGIKEVYESKIFIKIARIIEFRFMFGGRNPQFIQSFGRT